MTRGCTPSRRRGDRTWRERKAVVPTILVDKSNQVRVECRLVLVKCTLSVIDNLLDASSEENLFTREVLMNFLGSHIRATTDPSGSTRPLVKVACCDGRAIGRTVCRKVS